MNVCIHRRTTLDTTHSRNDPTLIARVGAVLIMLRLELVLCESWPNLAALTWAMAAIAFAATLDLVVNDLMPPRFRLRRTKRMRFLIYMGASFINGIVAFYAAELFPHSVSFTIGYLLISLWLMLIAGRDLVHQINKDML